MDTVGRSTWSALGTSVHVLTTQAATIDAAAQAVHRVLREVDLACSRFRADSELVALNAAAGRRVRLSPLLFDAIEAAVHAAQVTDGAVDPTIGNAIRLLGYDRDFAALPANAPGPLPVIEVVPGWRHIELDRATRSVRVPARVAIDLGSTGKALAADLAAAAAGRGVGSGVLVSLGGDIATAGESPEGGWRITCAEDSSLAPDAPDTGNETVAIRGGALATSSTTVRRWTAGGVVRHHIVDPATGLPAGGPWRTATVVAANCVDANAASTAAIVLGDAAVPWLRQRGLAARLVGHDGSITRVAGWPEPAEAAA